MIKILHILTDSNIGGAGRYLISYLKYADRSRFAFQVVVPRRSALIPEIKALEVPVIEADGIAERSFSTAAVRELKRIIRAEKPELVHTHGSLSGRIAAKQCGVKVIYTRHSAFPVPGYLKHGPGHWLYGAIGRRYADHILAVSPATVQNLTDCGIPASRITMMMNGAPAQRVLPPEERSAIRAELGIPEGVFTAGLLARIEPYKGQQLLLDAARELLDRGCEFRILIAGAGSAETALRERIEALGLSEQVLYLGFVQDVGRILNVLDVQLNCSYGTEASSIALIEGMSLGLATVASDYGGNPWMVEDGKTGLLFESGNSHDLAEKLFRVMADRRLLEELRVNARRAYSARFTGEIFAGNIEAVYDQTIHHK